MIQEEKIKILFSASQIQRKVKKIASQIATDFENQELIVIGILKGAIPFLKDLCEAIEKEHKNVRIKQDFLGVSSYGCSHIAETGPRIYLDISESIFRKQVLVIEDIIDKGNTAQAILKYLSTKKPAQLKLCTLLIRKGCSQKADYYGFIIDKNLWAVGYGLDEKGYLRSLDFLGCLEKNEVSKNSP